MTLKDVRLLVEARIREKEQARTEATIRASDRLNAANENIMTAVLNPLDDVRARAEAARRNIDDLLAELDRRDGLSEEIRTLKAQIE